MNKFILSFILVLQSAFVFAGCSDQPTALNCATSPVAVQLPLCSLEQTFVFDGAQVQTISVDYQGITYTQTFTYSAGEISDISAWIATCP